MLSDPGMFHIVAELVLVLSDSDLFHIVAELVLVLSDPGLFHPAVLVSCVVALTQWQNLCWCSPIQVCII